MAAQSVFVENPRGRRDAAQYRSPTMNAGAFLRQRLFRTALYGTAVAGSVVGLGIGMVFYVVFPQWIGFGWGVVAYGAAAAALLIIAWLTESPAYRWNLENLKKGLDAETRVGQVIERAITAEHCAVAHSVTESAIAQVGDVDHIVATPKAVWVIETKYKAVPPNRLSDTVNRIGDNMGAVREWAGQLAPGKVTPVRGCLVLAYDQTPFKKKIFDAKKKDGGKEKVELYTKNSLKLLSVEIAGEAQEMQSLDEQIAEEIRKLNGTCV